MAEQQAALRQQMLMLGLRRPLTSVVLDITRLHNLPDPDTLAEALAAAVGTDAVFSRAACVADTADQRRFAAMLREMATRPDDVAVFETEDDALEWLGIAPAP